MLNEEQLFLIKQLHYNSSFGMLDCRKALERNDWDYDKAKAELDNLEDSMRLVTFVNLKPQSPQVKLDEVIKIIDDRIYKVDDMRRDYLSQNNGYMYSHMVEIIEELKDLKKEILNKYNI